MISTAVVLVVICHSSGWKTGYIKIAGKKEGRGPRL